MCEDNSMKDVLAQDCAMVPIEVKNAHSQVVTRIENDVHNVICFFNFLHV